MTAEQFAYWLQGFAELHEQPPTAEQWAMIREHLMLVFKKVTPPMRITEPAVPYSPPWQGFYQPPVLPAISPADWTTIC